MHVDGSEPNLINFKYDLTQDYSTLNTSKRQGRPVNLKTFKPRPAYDSLLPLNPNKKRDLLAVRLKSPMPRL